LRFYSPQGDQSGRSEAASDDINEFFKSILQSKRLKPEEKRDLEVIARLQSKVDSEIEDAKKLAKQQARTIYTCEGCGLQVMGIMAFAEHDEATRHMTYRGKKVTFEGIQ